MDKQSLIEQRILGYTKLKMLLEDEREAINFILTGAVDDPPHDRLVIVKHKQRLLEIENEIAAGEQFIADYMARQADTEKEKIYVDEIKATYEDIKRDALAIMTDVNAPQPLRDRLKATINMIDNPDFVNQPVELQNKYYINLVTIISQVMPKERGKNSKIISLK